MSGHSHWSTIKHKKAAADAKRGKVFSKLARVITLAAKSGGGDPDMNLRLRYAIDEARAANMPVDSIARAVKKGLGGDSTDHWEEIVFEGYGPGGVALMVAALTDNRNRTVPEVRRLFDSSGGSFGQTGSVGWMFKTVGYFLVKKEAVTEDALTEAAVNGGADDIQQEGDYWEVYCSPGDFMAVRTALQESGIEWENAEVTRIATTETTVTADVARKVMKLVAALEDNDDVQNVYNNMAMTAEVIAVLEADE